MNEFSESLKGYVDRMICIRSLSSPEIRGISNPEVYSSLLRQNFKVIGELAAENRDMISGLIDPILESQEALDPEVIRMIGELNEELLNAAEVENIDLPLAALLTGRLLKDADGKEDTDYRIAMLDKELENSYLLVNMTKRIISEPEIINSCRKKGIDAHKKLLVYLDKELFSSLSPESRGLVLTDSRYGAALYEGQDPQDISMPEEQLRILERALEIAEDPFYHDAVPDFDWRYHIFRTYEYLMHTGYDFPMTDIAEKTLKYAERCVQIWESDPEYYKELSQYVELEGRLLKVRYLAGRITEKEYREKLLTIYKERIPEDYSTAGYDMNVQYPLDYLSLLDPEKISEEDARIATDIYRSALIYIFHMPKLGLLSVTLDPYSKMLTDFREFPGGIGFEEMGLRSFAALHPPTHIHSRMVADLSRCLAEHLLKMKPELFSEVFSYLGLEAVAENREQVIDFTYHAALCHDFGKLMIIDTIFVYGRKLFDMEFELIRQHPDIGYMLLSSHSSTKKYADVARGHHLWYDGSRGYPQGFDVMNSPLKTVIDLVTIADCMDAATDSVGRSYNRGKTFSEYEQEVIRDAGSRYAPWAPELLKDADTRRELEDLLGKGRIKLYAETYRLLESL